MERLSAEVTAQRLGVKLQTVYAYVSRGALISHRGPDGRRSWFDAREVDRLARRGRPRRSSNPPALDFTIETDLTLIGDHRIAHRGIDQSELARSATFEQVAELLWTGDLPELPPRWDLDRSQPSPVDLGRALHDPLDRIRTSVVLGGARHRGSTDRSPEAVADVARSLIVDAVASLGRGNGTADRVPAFVLPDGGRVTGSIAGRLWRHLASRRAAPGMVASLNAALVALADHEMASSTLAARVAASTRADPHSVVLAGLGPLDGPLHGGASRGVARLLRDAAGVGARAAVDRALERDERLPGFGHPLYPAGDPRCALLLALLREARTDPRRMALVDEVLAVGSDRVPVRANVDFSLGALVHLAGMADSSGEVIFAIARSAGWVAHAIEEYGEAPLRFRSRAVPRRADQREGASSTSERMLPAGSVNQAMRGISPLPSLVMPRSS